MGFRVQLEVGNCTEVYSIPGLRVLRLELRAWGLEFRVV